MSYTYEDLVRLPLPKPYYQEFVDLLSKTNKNGNILDESAANPPNEVDQHRSRWHLGKLEGNSYKDKPTYILATSAREKAIAALEGPSQTYKQEILDMWLSVVDKMTEFEKVMAGWDKV